MNKFAESLLSLVWAMQSEAFKGFLSAVNAVTDEQIDHTIRAIIEKPELLERLHARSGNRPANLRRRAADVSESDLDIRNGVARIAIDGPMMKQVPSILNFLDIKATSTEAKRAELVAALESDRVESIVLDIDSPGGTVDGTAALADDVAAVRGLKPISARVDDLMASAALWVGSQADHIEIGPSAAVGSIGVLAVVDDRSRQYENKGIKVHVVSSGELKGSFVEGSHVTKAQIADLKRNVDTYAELFIEAVARGRNMTHEDIAGIATGQMWIGTEAMELGLVDAVDAGDGANATVRGVEPAMAARAGGIIASTEPVAGIDYDPQFDSLEEFLAAAATADSARARLRISETNAAPAAQQEQTMTEEERNEMEKLRADNAAWKIKVEAQEAEAERVRLETEAGQAAKREALLTQYADRFPEPAVRASVTKMVETMKPDLAETYLKTLPQITRPDRESTADIVEGAIEQARHGGPVTIEERSLGKSFSQSPDRVRDMVALGGADIERIDHEREEIDGKVVMVPVAVMRDGTRLKRKELKKALGLRGALAGIVFLIASLFATGAQAGALTDARATQCRLRGITKSYLMTASTTIYAGSLVLIDSNGTAIPAASSASNANVAGVAQETKTSAATGSHWIRVSDGVICKFAGATLGQDDVGSIVYALDDQTVDETIGTNTGVAGVLIQYVSASVGWVYVSSLINFGRVATVADPTTMAGDLTLGGGTGALTFSIASTIVLLDNDATSLSIGSTGATDFMVIDTGNDSEELIITGYAATDALSVAAGNVSFDADLLVAGDTTLSGGANSLNFDTGDETITIKDNDTTSLQLGSTGALDFMVWDSGDDSEELIITGYAGTDAFSVAAGNASFDADVLVTGSLDVVAQTIPVDMSGFRTFDDFDVFLTNVASDDDDLTFLQGTPGTNASTLESVDCGGLADTTQKAAFWITLPHNYLAGSTVTISSNVGMVTTVGDQSATLDFSCWVPDYANEDGTVSGDLITPAAQSVNSTTFADVDFVVDDDASGYVFGAGDVVQCQITAVCDDDGDAAGGITIRINKMTVVVSP